jgi:hypothetical protein
MQQSPQFCGGKPGSLTSTGVGLIQSGSVFGRSLKRVNPVLQVCNFQVQHLQSFNDGAEQVFHVSSCQHDTAQSKSR